MRAVGLQYIDDANENGHAQERGSDARHHPPASQWEAQHHGGEEQEAKDQVEDGEPAVLSGAITEDASHLYGQSRKRERIPEQNAEDVEE